jgi:hypothetical protein
MFCAFFESWKFSEDSKTPKTALNQQSESCKRPTKSKGVGSNPTFSAGFSL